MMLTLKYFGAVADVTQKQKEQLHFEAAGSIENVRLQLEANYPEIKKLSYAFAINQSIAKGNETLKENDELALLPPFAGG